MPARKRLIWKHVLLALMIGLLLPGCGCAPRLRRFQTVFTDVFDTVTVLTAYAADQEQFDLLAEEAHRELLEYHRLFDIYREYPDTVNLCTLNRLGHEEALAVAPPILDMLEDAVTLSRQSSGQMNPAMGSVLRLWHEAREQGQADPAGAALPSPKALAEAAQHTALSQLILDREAGTVYLADPGLLLDVGAVAKGWAAQQICVQLQEAGYDSFLLSIGGNVCARGTKADGSSWVVGVENPGESDYLARLQLSDMCAVTSGSYQRYYTVDGQDYHHIIDPDSLYPAEGYRLITVLHCDSATADALSTALFCMSREEGQTLARTMDAQVLWLLEDGSLHMTEGFQNFLEK